MRIVLTIGSSMYPALQSGDAVVVRPMGTNMPSRGDILLVMGQGYELCHRYVGTYIEAGRTLYVTRGDTHREPDHPVDPEAVTGRVAHIERMGRSAALRGLLSLISRALLVMPPLFFAFNRLCLMARDIFRSAGIMPGT